MKKIVILLLLLNIVGFLTAQSAYDSLIMVLNSSEHDTLKISKTINYVDRYFYNQPAVTDSILGCCLSKNCA